MAGDRGHGLIIKHPPSTPAIAVRFRTMLYHPSGTRERRHAAQKAAAFPVLIQFNGQELSISGPFLEGHRLTAVEARALCLFRAERIRKNLARWFERHPSATPSDLMTQVKKLDEEFEFQPGQRLLERLPTGSLPEEIARLVRLTGKAAEDQDLQAEARLRVDARQAIADRALKELL